LSASAQILNRISFLDCGMTVQRVFSFPDEAEANTRATRDRAIDVIRIVSLVGVVVGHTIMATSIIRDDVLIGSNLLCVAVMLAALIGARFLAGDRLVTAARVCAASTPANTR
jgi:hypothetical protein